MTENLTQYWIDEDETIYAVWIEEDIPLCDREIDSKGQE